MHRLFLELIPGGVPVKKSTAQYQVLLATVRPRDPAGKTRRRMAAEELADIGRLDAKLKTMKAELKAAVLASGSHLMDIHGIGPAGAARILADVGDVARFPNRAHFASWTGTAPIDASSGQHTHHRLSQGREPPDQPRALPGRPPPAPPRHPRPRLLPAPRRGGQDPDGSDALPAAAPARRGLPPTRRRRTSTAGGPGRALRGDSIVQRGRPSPGHRHFGPATSRTRTHDPTPATSRATPPSGPDRRHTTAARPR